MRRTAGSRFEFVCPTCRNHFVYDDPIAPFCTGPHPSLDEHEVTLMIPEEALEAAVAPEIVLPGRIIS